jgi:hypothetical protein
MSNRAAVIGERLALVRAGASGSLALHMDGTAIGIDESDQSARVDLRSNALQAACWAGQLEVASLLLGRGADPNKAREHNGGSPLCIAAHAGHAAVVRLLASSGAELNHGNINKATPVFIAAENDSEQALRALLGLGADPDLPDKTGCSPCYIAASRGHSSCLGVLRNYGADIDAAPPDGAAPLHIAVARGRLRCFLMLIDGGARTDGLASVGRPAVMGPSGDDSSPALWNLRQLIMAKYAIHANTREAFLKPLSVAEGPALLVGARQRLAWMGQRLPGGRKLTADLQRHVSQRYLAPRARLDVASRAMMQMAVAAAPAEVTDGTVRNQSVVGTVPALGSREKKRRIDAAD